MNQSLRGALAANESYRRENTQLRQQVAELEQAEARAEATGNHNSELRYRVRELTEALEKIAAKPNSTELPTVNAVRDAQRMRDIARTALGKSGEQGK